LRLETIGPPTDLPAHWPQPFPAKRPCPLARIRDLEVRLAGSDDEVRAAQTVRHRVFVEELGARAQAGIDGLEADGFDTICDHLIVLDRSLPGSDLDRVVGTYRLLRQENAARAHGFYSQGEFDLSSLMARHPHKQFLELGRSCVLPSYRSKRTIEALWQGIWNYVNAHDIDVMVGCASFPGAVPAIHAQALSFLAQNCGVDAEWRVSALPHRYQEMDLVPAEAVSARVATAGMPTLIKGYLRIGARFGDGCVIDREFSTVDVFVVMPVASIRARYVDYYTREAG